MEFLQLQYFYESAKNESFAKTAEKFIVPASSVSASVKRLENELGVELFDRTSNRIILNERGRLLADSLREIFDKLDNTVAMISEKSEENNVINILIKARRKWITDLIIEYKERNPDTHFRISNDFNITDFQDFDVIIDEQSDLYDGFERFLLIIEKICVKASKDSPLVGQKLNFSQLKDQPFIMTRKSNGMRKLLEHTAKTHGFTPDIAIECNDTYCLARYIKAGMGLSLGSVRALSDELENGIVALDVVDFNETQSVYMYHRSPNVRDTALKNFCEFLRLKGRQ